MRSRNMIAIIDHTGWIVAVGHTIPDAWEKAVSQRSLGVIELRSLGWDWRRCTVSIANDDRESEGGRG